MKLKPAHDFTSDGWNPFCIRDMAWPFLNFWWSSDHVYVLRRRGNRGIIATRQSIEISLWSCVRTLKLWPGKHYYLIHLMGKMLTQSQYGWDIFTIGTVMKPALMSKGELLCQQSGSEQNFSVPFSVCCQWHPKILLFGQMNIFFSIALWDTDTPTIVYRHEDCLAQQLWRGGIVFVFPQEVWVISVEKQLHMYIIFYLGSSVFVLIGVTRLDRIIIFLRHFVAGIGWSFGWF